VNEGMRRVPFSWRKRRVVKWHDSYCVVASWSLEEQGRVPILARAAGLGFAVHKGRLAGDISELSSERAESLSSSEREDWMEAEPATRRPSAARFSPSCPNRSIFSRPSERKQDCLFARLVCPHLMPLPLKFPSQRLILDAPANRTILALDSSCPPPSSPPSLLLLTTHPFSSTSLLLLSPSPFPSHLSPPRMSSQYIPLPSSTSVSNALGGLNFTLPSLDGRTILGSLLALFATGLVLEQVSLIEPRYLSFISGGKVEGERRWEEGEGEGRGRERARATLVPLRRRVFAAKTTKKALSRAPSSLI